MRVEPSRWSDVSSNELVDTLDGSVLRVSRQK